MTFMQIHSGWIADGGVRGVDGDIFTIGLLLRVHGAKSLNMCHHEANETHNLQFRNLDELTASCCYASTFTLNANTKVEKVATKLLEIRRAGSFWSFLNKGCKRPEEQMSVSQKVCERPAAPEAGLGQCASMKLGPSVWFVGF